MVKRQTAEKSTWQSKSAPSSDMQLYVRGVPFTLDRELLAAKSAKVSAIMEENPQGDISCSLRDIPGDPDAFELLARFCHGYELKISNENVVPLICLACYFDMTETHSTDNLLKRALTFFEQRILPSWNDTIKALCSAQNVLQQAVDLGLIDACIDSIAAKALIDPRLLGEPIKKSIDDDRSDDDDDEDDEDYRPNARRRLFDIDWKSEDLTALPLQLYEPIIHAINQRGVPSEYVNGSICQYAKKWALLGCFEGEDMSIYKRNAQRDVIEAVERLLPPERGLLPCTLLFEMLRSAIGLEASSECINGFEIKIGKQLDQATVKDLLIPSQGYAKEVQYDIECVRRILKNFYGNYSSCNISGLITVAELIEDFLGEIASDIDLKTETFLSLAEMSIAAAFGTHRNSDGIYRAIDIYLDKHSYLTETEREEVCRVLDCHKLSPEACQHAAKNERLPMRMVVQVLFVAQLQMRDEIKREFQVSNAIQRQAEVEKEEEEKDMKLGYAQEEARMEMEKMSIKVLELEKECYVMKKEIESSCNNSHSHGLTKKKKSSMWGEIKRKFGCTSSVDDYQSQVKKKKLQSRYAP